MRTAHYSKLDSPEPASCPSLLVKGCCGLLFVAAVVAFGRPVAAEAHGGGARRSDRVEAHQKGEVSSSLLALRRMPKRNRILARLVEDDAPIPPGSKKVQFIRHGEGYHNVAQREWRSRPGWEGSTEPYTVDTDPGGRYVDALLTEEGEAQARALQARTTRTAAPQLLVVSPMRRATQTGLLAFAPHVAAGRLPVLAHELCHERAGRHTCDRRLGRAELTKQFGARVSYALIESEEDPYWGDGVAREPWGGVVARGAAFAAWLRARPEVHVAVAAHSAWLLAMFNAVLTTADGDEATRGWFGTGEMRTVLLTWE